MEIPVPKGVTPGEPFLPHHLALMVEAHCVATSPDEMHKPGVMAAGTALIPLRECLQTQHAGAVYKTQLIYQNMIDSNPGYDGYKGDLTVTFDQVDAPRGRNPFKAPDSQTIDHFAPEEVNPVIGAAIEASIEFCPPTPSVLMPRWFCRHSDSTNSWFRGRFLVPSNAISQSKNLGGRKLSTAVSGGHILMFRSKLPKPT